MKSKFTLLTLFVFLSFFAFPQWKSVGMPGATIKMLKSVKGSLYASAVNNSTFVGGLYRSQDHGASWQLIDSTDFKFVYVNDMTYDSTNNLYVVVCTAQNGVFSSPDALVWTKSTALWSGDGITYINGKLVIANPGSGVGLSTNGGSTWTVSNSGLGYPYYIHYVTRIEDTLYLSDQNLYPVLRSYNGGATWVKYSDSLSYFANCYYKFKGSVYTGLYLNGVRKYSSGYWNTYSTGLPSTRNLNALAAQGDTLYCGGDSIGVWLNTSGTWQDFTCGLSSNSCVNKLIVDNGTLLAGTTNGIWKINLKTGCTPVGIESSSATNEISLYPSVTHTSIHVNSPTTPLAMLVYNCNGAEVLSLKNQSSIDVSKMVPGIYFVRIMLTPGEITVRKFVVD